jgi:type 1 glutamine amidotransferase
MLRSAGAAAVAAGLSGFPFAWPALAQRANRPKKKRLLVYSRSQGFQHSVVDASKKRPSLVDSTWTVLAEKNGFEIECTKDGRIFVPETLAKFDAFFFYTTGDLTAEKSADNTPPMTKDGKKALLDAVAAGKGFLGSHSATDTFHSLNDEPKGRQVNQQSAEIDPYIAMIGGEFIRHGDQQKATMHVVDHSFPGLKDVADFNITEEWYALKNFQPDLHVLLVQETAGMKGEHYQRPNFPATWARMHGKGRVFYTSLGHREDVWTSPTFQNLLVGAAAWAFGQADADVSPNLSKATPESAQLPNYAPTKKQ